MNIKQHSNFTPIEHLAVTITNGLLVSNVGLMGLSQIEKSETKKT